MDEKEHLKMDKIKNNTLLSAQKAAQKKYDQKTKMVSVKYTLSDMKEYQRLKSYLDMSGQSTNKFIKSLIHNFFESGQDQRNVTNRVKTPIEEIEQRMEEGEFQERTNDEICIKLIKEMNNIF